jgi:hypothetical protein
VDFLVVFLAVAILETPPFNPQQRVVEIFRAWRCHSGRDAVFNLRSSVNAFVQNARHFLSRGARKVMRCVEYLQCEMHSLRGVAGVMSDAASIYYFLLHLFVRTPRVVAFVIAEFATPPQSMSRARRLESLMNAGSQVEGVISSAARERISSTSHKRPIPS